MSHFAMFFRLSETRENIEKWEVGKYFAHPSFVPAHRVGMHQSHMPIHYFAHFVDGITEGALLELTEMSRCIHYRWWYATKNCTYCSYIFAFDFQEICTNQRVYFIANSGIISNTVTNVTVTNIDRIRYLRKSDSCGCFDRMWASNARPFLWKESQKAHFSRLQLNLFSFDMIDLSQDSNTWG